MENLLRDVRYGVRMLIKNSGFTAVAIIALALGIGANTAIFSVVNAVLLRPLPYDNPDQLVWIWENNATNDIQKEPASPPNFADWREQNQSFSDMAAFARSSPILTSGGEPERIPGSVVTVGFFSVLKANARLGRTFVPDEDKPGNNRVVVLSYRLWQRLFGSDESIVGNKITLNGNPHTVVGVMPPDFQHPIPGERNVAELWTPLGMDLKQQARRGDFLSVIARLKPGVSLGQARAEMGTIAKNLEQQYPATNTGWDVTVIPLHERFAGDVRSALLVLLGAVCFLLLIACANVANLLLARAASRQKEIAIRAALGAGRRRLIQQLLTESLVLALGGGALGLLLALWGVEILIALSPGNIPRIEQVSLDSRVLFFTLALSLITGVVFGLLPALQASSHHLNESLKEGGRSSIDSVRGGRMRNLLAASEVAFALMLLIGAGLMIKSFVRLQEVNPGFNPDRVLTMELSLPRSKYSEGPQVVAFYKQLLDRVQALPGVEAAGAISTLPLSGGGDVIAFAIEGRPQSLTDRTPDAEYRVISPDYFRTMSIPLLRGRLFTDQDNLQAPQALLVSETMARRFWPGEDPIGKRINTGNPQTSPWRTIVGIVGDIRHEGLSADPYPQMYAPYTQVPRQGLALVTRTTSDPMALVGPIRSQIWEMDKDQPLHNVRTMEQLLSSSVARPRFNMQLITIFAAIAIILSAVGIYGVMSYSVTQRTHELGVRMALGAQAGDILKMVVGKGLQLSLLGVAAGLVGAFVLTRWMSSLLFGVSATDPVIFAAIPLTLMAVALLASYIPARRATKVDPMIALRYE